MITIRTSACCTYRKANFQNSAADITEADINESLPEKIYTLPARAGVFEASTRYKPYMSHLINFCKRFELNNLVSPNTKKKQVLTSTVLPLDTVMASSLAYHLRTQWIHTALQDPCLFHATLYGASTSIDIFSISLHPGTVKTYVYLLPDPRTLLNRWSDKL